MMIVQIEQTAWAKRFLVACPTDYRQAIALAEKVEWVTIEKRDEHSAKGDFVWAIIPEIDTEFWLDGMKTKREALAVCKEMGGRTHR